MVRTRPRTARLVASGVVVLLLLLSGCAQEEPEPKFAEEPNATPTVEDEETAEEFIRRWNDEMTRMQQGDTTEYRKLAGKCEPCMKTADRVDEYYAAGGFVETEGRQVRSIRRSERLVGVPHLYLVNVISAPTQYKESASSPVQSLEGGRALFEVQLSGEDGNWEVIDTIQVPQ